MVRERNESGQYVETVGPDDVLDVFETVDGPVIMSSDVADALECTTEAARQKLSRLVDDGTLGTRKGGRTKVYWRRDTAPGSETADTTPSDVASVLDRWSHGRTEAEQEASRQTAVGSLRWLRDHGETARKMDVPLDEWAADDPEGRTTETLWTEVVRSAWNHAVEQGAVEQPHSRGYRWVGDA